MAAQGGDMAPAAASPPALASPPADVAAQCLPLTTTSDVSSTPQQSERCVRATHARRGGDNTHVQAEAPRRGERANF